MFLLISIGPIRGQGKLGPGAGGRGDGHVGVSVVVGGDLSVSGDVIVRPGELNKLRKLTSHLVSVTSMQTFSVLASRSAPIECKYFTTAK